MGNYNYTGEYKELIQKQEISRKKILNFLNTIPNSKEIIHEFESIIGVHSHQIDIIEEDLLHLKWDADDQDYKIQDQDREIENLKSKLIDYGLEDCENSLDNIMKLELWMVAKDKFSLTELEQKFGGNKFEII